MSQGVRALILSLAGMLAGCNLTLTESTSITTTDLDARLGTIISEQRLTGNPARGLQLPDINSPQAQLGMKLFFSTTLGGENDTACVTCHHPMLGGGDNLSLPVGVGAREPELLGPGRRLYGHLPVAIPRNAPTTFNVALWKKSMFHDGRIQTLESKSSVISTPDVDFGTRDILGGQNLVQAQARFPIVSPDEMRGGLLLDASNQKVRTTLAKRLEKNWSDDFQKALGYKEKPKYNIVTEQNTSFLIGEYERSQVFIENPWKAYIEGNKSVLSEKAKKGAVLFFSSIGEGGAGCSSCHSGDFFTNEEFYNVALPQIGMGTGGGVKTTADQGCHDVTKDPADKFRFRTPSLLNVEVTGPWGHNGAYTSLEGVVKHMLDPVNSAKNYNPDQLLQAGIHIKDLQENTQAALDAGIEIPVKPEIKPDDVQNLVEFLRALTDPCVKNRECMSQWIPAPESNDPDGATLHAVDYLGKLL